MSIEQIINSLYTLGNAVDTLEQEVIRLEAEKAAAAEKAKQAAAAPQAAPVAKPGKQLPGLPGQNDLFGEWTAPGGRAANVNATKTLAKKLDNAIENVQWLLKAGA